MLGLLGPAFRINCNKITYRKTPLFVLAFNLWLGMEMGTRRERDAYKNQKIFMNLI
jgi:hypothetical protein